MRAKNTMRKVLSGMLALALLLQPMCYQAQENLTEKASNVSILMQEPMNELFAKNITDDVDASIENLEYTYSFKTDRRNSMSADVGVDMEMTVLGADYEIEASGEVEGEKLSSRHVLWMGPLEGEITVDGVEYFVIVGFTKLNEAVQMSVTIQSKDGDEAIEPVMFSFGDCVITEDIYQEINENQQDVSYESTASNSGTSATTYTMNSRKAVIEEVCFGGASTPSDFKLKVTRAVGFTDSDITCNGQELQGYLDEKTNRIAISIKTKCEDLEEYYSSYGLAYAEVRSMKYVLKTGRARVLFIDQMESYDFNLSGSSSTGLISALFSDAIACLDKNLPAAFLTELFKGLSGTVKDDVTANYSTVEVTFGVSDSANFDKCGKGMPLIFIPGRYSTNPTGVQDFVLETSVRYRMSVLENDSDYFIFFYCDTLTASAPLNITVK